jgi:hypothetical protein
LAVATQLGFQYLGVNEFENNGKHCGRSIMNTMPNASLLDHDHDLDRIAISPIPAVNVATVPQRSPLRYPGGKSL